MKKTSIALLILIIVNIIFTTFLFVEYIRFRPMLQDLSEHYLIEVKK